MEFTVNPSESGGLDPEVIIRPTHREGCFLVSDLDDETPRLHAVRSIRLRRVGEEALISMLNGERDGVSLGLLYLITGSTSSYIIRAPYTASCEEYPNTKIAKMISVNTLREMEPFVESYSFDRIIDESSRKS